MTWAGLSFANAGAWWGLLAVPALVAVHFFQQRSRRVELSTRFLIEAVAPLSQGGRTWERFRASRAFVGQLLAILFLVWVLAEPRWPRADSTQTVVIIIDDALAMQAVAEEARVAARELMAASIGGAAKTEWVVLGSDPRAPLRYRGPELSAAQAAVAGWRPSLGTHDYAAAVRAGRALAAAGIGIGVSWLVTDRESKVPPDQAAIGVGRVVANVGFAGGSVQRSASGEHHWRAVVKNHVSEPQSRSWWVESSTGKSELRPVELPGEGVVELSGVWPTGAERMTLHLQGDGFAADDVLPMVRPQAKRLSARVALAGERREFFKKLLGGIEGLELGASVSPGLLVLEQTVLGTEAAGAAVILATETGAEAKKTTAPTWLRAPVVAERNELVAGLNWQGWLGTGVGNLVMDASDEGLLWQAEAPLVWLRAGRAGTRTLVLNFDWAAGNAARLPATVLMLRRYVEAVRDAQPEPYAGNFDTGSVVPLTEEGAAGEPETWALEIEGGERRELKDSERVLLRAPAEAGFFTVKRGRETRVLGAAQFADARQGDFRDATAFRRDPPAGERAAAQARTTQGDPWQAAWLALAGAALLASWWPGRTGPEVAAKTIERRRA